MKQWHRVGTLIAATALGLLVLMPAAPSLADSYRWQPPTARFHPPAFQRDRRELWADRAEVRQDQQELWRDQRAHRWGEVAQDRRELWQDRRELQRDAWAVRHAPHPWW